MKYFKTELIEEFIKKQGINDAGFCVLYRIEEKELNMFMKSSLDVDIEVVFKIARALKIKVYELFY